MGEKEIYQETLPDGSVRNVHVDHDEEKVYLETGHLHPVTGAPLLRFSSCNTLPYPKKPAPTVEEPLDLEPLEAPVVPEPDFLAPLEPPFHEARVIDTDLEFDAQETPIDPDEQAESEAED